MTSHQVTTISTSLEELMSQEPTPAERALGEAYFNEEHWKLPTKTFRTKDSDVAEVVANVFDWFLGGHEIQVKGGEIFVTSRGYYHYIGA